MSVHFHPRERATSCWLRQEMRKVLLLVPLISTTGGCGSKPFASDEEGDDETDDELILEGEPVPTTAEDDAPGSVSTCVPPGVAALVAETPAAAQVRGLAMPAFSKAAAIFCCWFISEIFAGPDSGVRRITSTRESLVGLVRKFSAPLRRENERELNDSENPAAEIDLLASSS